MSAITAAADLLDRLALAGNTLRVLPGEMLHVGGPRPDEGTVTELRELKGTILELLAERNRVCAHPCACCGKFAFREPARACHWCTHPAAAPRDEAKPQPTPDDSPRCATCRGGNTRTP